MKLLRKEYERAIQIKQMVAEDEILLSLPDFDYVQYAICTNDEPLEKIKARMFTMQCFREQYGITNTALQGVELFHAQALRHPGIILDIEYPHGEPNFLNISDMAAFFPSKIKTYHDWRAVLGSIYYSWECQLPDFECMRIGFSSICECMGSNHKNFDPRFYRKLGNELHKVYPKNQKTTYFIHSPPVVKFVWDVMKDTLPDHVRGKVHIDEEIPGLEDTRLDVLLNTPTEEMAQQRLSLKVARFLVNRYQNRDSFSLDMAEVVETL